MLGDSITRTLRTVFIFLDIPHPFHRPIRTLIARRVLLRPFLKLAPISALPILTNARDTIHLTLDGTRGIICVTEDLPSQSVKTVGDMVPFSALWFAKSVLLHGDVDNFLLKGQQMSTVVRIGRHILDNGGYGSHVGYIRLLSRPTGSVELEAIL